MHKKSASREVSSITVPAAWAVHELAGAGLPDQRLLKRAHLIMTQLGERPAASLPQASGGWSQTKAAYRFLDNDAVNPQALLAAHTQATVGRSRTTPWCWPCRTPPRSIIRPTRKPRGWVRSATIGTKPLACGCTARWRSAWGENHWACCWRRLLLGLSPLRLFAAGATANRQPIAEKESQRWWTV